MMSDEQICEIATRAGLEVGFRDARGERIQTPVHALARVLGSLGLDVADDESRQRTLDALRRDGDRLVAATIPVEADTPIQLPVRFNGPTRFRIELEDGTVREGEGRSDGDRLALDALPAGYHRICLEAAGRSDRATLVVAPTTCFLPDVLLGDGRGYGLTAQVYGLRSARNYGIGDLGDVAELAEGAGCFGACFLGLSPLHALFPTDRAKISPYSPSSRLFVDPIYIDPTQLPEFNGSDAARMLAEPSNAATLDRLRNGDLVDHAASWGLKKAALRLYWSRIASDSEPRFLAYRAELGEPLELHATFEALTEHFAECGAGWVGDWPDAFRDAHGEAVRGWRDANPSKVAFHAWLQWIADTQLAAAQARALDAGMTVGLYRDLAVGCDKGGGELWARPDWFIPGVAVGAPPDLFQPAGQNWGLPPFNPRTLEEQELGAFRTLVRMNMRHAGAIRIDHAFQLQRLYVVPDGLPGSEGVYINYPFAALLAVLRIESHRARALVIAEDLGTAPEGFSDAIMASNLLSYRILSFERDGAAFKAPADYPRKALAAIATHDLPTFAGWWKGLDTDLREQFDVYTQEQAAKERSDRVVDLIEFSSALHRTGIAKSAGVAAEPPFAAAFRFVARTPSMLVAVQLEDVLADHEQANLPGPDMGHPNWKRKVATTIDGILSPGGPLAAAAAPLIAEGRSLASPPRLGRPAPVATYRLQFHKDFTFADATKALPYIAKFGVSHVYCSPILKARSGSTHGYDTVDPTQINPELGGLDAFESFAAAAKGAGMGLLLDIVPNHMGVGGADNPWWLSVLEWGPLSPFADTFDIDWERLGAHGKLVAPNLGAQYGETLEKGDLKLGFDASAGTFAVVFFEHKFPICPLTYPDILDRAVAVDASEGGEGIDGLLRVGEELRALAAEAGSRRHDVVATCERLKHRLVALAKRSSVAAAIEQALAVFNGTPGLPESFGTLHRLLERQSYRLSYWRVAASDVNYRRFFDIDSLAGVRIENPAVFERTHALIFDLVERDLIQGLRIDHIDGLADPKAYAGALQRAVGPDFYVVAEKILEPGETLRPWPLAGTTGYEMLNFIDGVFVDAAQEPVFDTLFREATGFAGSYDDALLAAKRQVLLESFSSELESLVSDTKRIADANRLTRDYSVNAIRIALGDFICAFPVYRTYITPRSLESADRALLGEVIARAKAITALPDRSVHDFLGSVLLGTVPTGRPGRAPATLVDRFRTRFQQLTGPVMAKSLEDTLFYRYSRFLVLNEVGGEPSRFGVSPADFHANNVERAETWPHALTTTATHDTKRGEDARARLLALSHDPKLWKDALAVWRDEVGTPEAPDRNDAYMFLQALVAVWPIELLEKDDGAVLAELRERFDAYVPKALREAKRHSKWIEPDEGYEKATTALFGRLLAEGSSFVARLRPILAEIARRGMLISLARTILKCTVPGVPDFYQGTGLFDFSLVDPDNRRPVDYAQRGTILRDDDTLEELLGHWRDGAVKLKLSSDLLDDRRENAAFYAAADYAPLTARGPSAEALIGYVRRAEGKALAVIVPRRSDGTKGWEDTTIDLPAGEWRDVLSGRAATSNGSAAVTDLFGSIPFAVLRTVE